MERREENMPCPAARFIYSGRAAQGRTRVSAPPAEAPGPGRRTGRRGEGFTGGRPRGFRGGERSGRRTESIALQESLGKFVQKITKRRFTPGKSRAIIEPHGVRRERAPVLCLGEIAVPRAADLQEVTSQEIPRLLRASWPAGLFRGSPGLHF